LTDDRAAGRGTDRAAAALFALLLLATGCDGGRSAPVERPNLVVVVIDTLRTDRLGSYGHARETSPAIDALAADAALFENAYSAAPWTKPAVASLLTGLHPRSHTVVRMINKLPESVETLGEILLAEGFATGAVVSHNLIGTRQRFDQGFEVFHEDQAKGHHHVSTEGVTSRALEVLEQMTGGERPFFLFVHYFDPHYDYMPHPEYGWAPKRVGRLRAGQMAKRATELDPPPNAEEVAFLEALYDEEVRFTDDGIGRLLSALREGGHFDDTVIALTADHGEEFYDRGCLGHTRTLYDELVRVPLLLREPGRRGGGRRIEAPVSLVSLTPTLLELLAVDVGDRRFEAPSIAGLVLGSPGASAIEHSIHTEVDFTPGSANVNRCPPTRADLRAVISGRYKLIHDRLAERYELYDLEADPAERRDLAAVRPELLARMREELEAEPSPSTAHESDERAFSPQEVEMLRDLGYIEPAS